MQTMMIKGETVTLLTRTKAGTDDFGADTYTETEVEVNNVLVGSPSSDDVIDAINLNGKHIVYVLGIPADDSNDWDNKNVIIRNKTYRTVGEATTYTDGNMPIWWAWNRQIKVESYE